MIGTKLRHVNDYYWCVVYTDENGMKTEAGNQASRLRILQWIVEHQEELPTSDGVVTLKRVGK